MKWSAPDREQINKKANEQCSQIANTIVIKDAQQQVRSNDTEGSTDDHPEVKPAVKIGATARNEKDETEEAGGLEYAKNFWHRVIIKKEDHSFGPNLDIKGANPL